MGKERLVELGGVLVCLGEICVEIGLLILDAVGGAKSS